MRELLIGAAVVIVIFVLAFTLNSGFLFGRTVVEREVFENSYQRSESLKAQIAADQAVTTEIERKLMNTSLTEQTRANLEAQLSAARVRMATARGKQ